MPVPSTASEAVARNSQDIRRSNRSLIRVTNRGVKMVNSATSEDRSQRKEAM